MKKVILFAAIIVNLLIFNQPAQAAVINENANSRAFVAQDINACRQQMKDKVASGEMTKAELKQCIENMKNGQCPSHDGEMCVN